MDSLDLQFIAYETAFSWISSAGLAYLGFAVLEMGWDYFLKLRADWKETGANIAIYFGNFLLEFLGFGVLFVIGLAVVEPLAFFELPKSWWFWPLALLAADLSYYWMHRLEHEIRLFWAVHVVHHSSPEFNMTTALRLSWLESLYEWIFFVPMILLGFGVVETLIALFIVIQYQSWIHTEKVGSLGILDKIFNTPSVHRVHHGSDAECLDKNYGGFLIVWDHLFGTYQAETQPVTYGLTEPLQSSNPFTINFHEFGNIARDLKSQKGWRKKKVALFGAPGSLNKDQ